MQRASLSFLPREQPVPGVLFGAAPPSAQLSLSAVSLAACQEAYIKLLEQEACSTGCASQPSEPEIKRRKVRKAALQSHVQSPPEHKHT